MEYHKILVPLDGSALAETVLSHAENIAKGCAEPRIVFVTVTQPVHVKTPVGERIEQLPSPHQSAILYYGGVNGPGKEISPATTSDQSVIIGKMAKTGYSYLSRIAQQFQDKGIQVEIAVLVGDVAEEITRFAEQQGVDLIIMASRGKRGLRRWDVGNAAAKVFRSTEIPIMLIKPPPGFKETKPKRKGQAI
jgi:nucleotide-binding universal stress UspA family protein